MIAAALIGAVLGIGLTVAWLSETVHKRYPDDWSRITGLDPETRKPIGWMPPEWTDRTVERLQR